MKNPDYVVVYPPDFDGELHIKAEPSKRDGPGFKSTTFTFSIAHKNGESQRDALQRAARDIASNRLR